METRFWGVRGSIAVSGQRYERVGGNTTCVEITHEGHRLILDGGTGLRALGEEIGFAPLKATLLFSHVHWDHIQGVPFFTPGFHPDSDLTVMGVARDTGRVRDALDAQMQPPAFPVGLAAMGGLKRFVDVPVDRTFEVGPFEITPMDLEHPDGVVAYRIDAGGRSVVFATDTEHGMVAGHPRIDQRVVTLARGADLLIHDAQYTDAEYVGAGGPPRVGWGHSTWGQAIEAARRAEVPLVGLFHHDPTRDDDGVSVIEAAARVSHPGAFAAREGQTVAL
jgi:phosphoribosyl 1,2-cyclic phosphodiesterase